MHTWRSILSFTCGLSLIVASSSCASLGKTSVHEARTISAAMNRAQAFIAMGEHKNALAIYSSAYDQYPGNEELKKAYIQSAEQIRRIAKAKLEKKDFASAGVTFHQLFTSGILNKKFAPDLSFNGEYLGTQMKVCSEALLHLGLLSYRQGEIEDAILVWKKVMIFDRGNRDIKRAIETATVQLEKLKHTQ